MPKFYVLLLFLFSVRCAFAQSFLKRYSNDKSAYLYVNHIADHDSGYVVFNSSYNNLSNASGFVNQFLRLGNSGQVIDGQSVKFLPASNADWNHQYAPSVFLGIDKSYTAIYHVYNGSDTVRSGTFIFNVDSNLSPVWCKHLHHNNTYWGKTAESINGNTYLLTGTLYDSVGLNFDHHAIIRQRLHKISGRGQTMFSKELLLAGGSYSGYGDLNKTAKNTLLTTISLDAFNNGNCSGFSNSALVELDTNATVLRSVQFNGLGLNRAHYLSNGNYLLNAFTPDNSCGSYSVIAMLDSNWQVLWAKKVISSNTLDLADVFDSQGSIYFYTRSIIGTHVSPYLLKLDYSGNILGQRQFTQPILLYGNLLIDSAGVFTTTSADTGAHLLFQKFLSFNDTTICSVMPACAPLVQNFALSPLPVSFYTVARSDSFYSYTLEMGSVQTTETDYCYNTGELNAHFVLAKDTYCIGEPVMFVSDSALTMGASTWIITGAANDTFVARDSLAYLFARPGQYAIKHIHTIGYCDDVWQDTLWVDGYEPSATNLPYCDTVYASQIQSPCNWQWPNGATGSFYIPPAGQGVINIEMNCGICNYTYTYSLQKLAVPVINPSVITLCTGNEFVFDGGALGLTGISWFDTTALLKRVFVRPGVFIAFISNGECSAIDTLTIIADECDDCEVYLPNSFSPNGDGNNDIFKVYTSCPLVHFIRNRIFNRWGELVFESYNEGGEWNGTYKGSDCPAGVFVYEVVIDYENARGMQQSRTYKGSLILIR